MRTLLILTLFFSMKVFAYNPNVGDQVEQEIIFNGVKFLQIKKIIDYDENYDEFLIEISDVNDPSAITHSKEPASSLFDKKYAMKNCKNGVGQPVSVTIGKQVIKGCDFKTKDGYRIYSDDVPFQLVKSEELLDNKFYTSKTILNFSFKGKP